MIFFDGACENNPGRGAFGFTHIQDGHECHFECGFIGYNSTNNIAEYTALLRALVYCKLNDLKCMKIFGDSLLVVNQVSGKWRVKKESLKEIHAQCVHIYDEMDIELSHIERSKNKRADYLSKLPLREECTQQSTRSYAIILP